MHTAIVTGGTKGIGRAIAQALLTDNHKVMITGRNGDQVADVVSALGAACGDPARIAGRAVDVRDRRAMDRLVVDTVDTFGNVSVLINNAGVGLFAPIDTMTDEEWASVIDTNLTGVFFASRAVLPVMKAAGGGWIINIASLAGRNYFANGGAYCASKAGLVAFSESLMLEARPHDIRVSVIMPGSVATEFSGPPEKSADDSWKLSSEDIAKTVMDLLHHSSRSLPSKIEIRPSRPK
jgi:NAD(P)-dependent dehydrogenase (short-subunit alcohol dehydrogenase family)